MVWLRVVLLNLKNYNLFQRRRERKKLEKLEQQPKQVRKLKKKYFDKMIWICSCRINSVPLIGIKSVMSFQDLDDHDPSQLPFFSWLWITMVDLRRDSIVVSYYLSLNFEFGFFFSIDYNLLPYLESPISSLVE